MHGKVGKRVSYCFYVSSLLLALTAQGCASCARHVAELSDIIRTKSNEHHDLANIRHDVRDELADQREEIRRLNAEREVEQAQIMAERAKIEMEFCRANQEVERENLRSNIEESVESKMALSVGYGFKLTDASVDVDALKQAIKKHEDENLKGPEPKPCSSCDRVCGCGTGNVRRRCPICRHKQCEAENDCGGPEALKRAEQLPVKSMPVTSIPINVKAELALHVRNPTVETTRIIRKPPAKIPCCCPTCTGGGSCTKPVAGIADDELNPKAPPVPQIPKKNYSEPARQVIKIAEAKKESLAEPPLPDDENLVEMK